MIIVYKGSKINSKYSTSPAQIKISKAFYIKCTISRDVYVSQKSTVGTFFIKKIWFIIIFRVTLVRTSNY